MYTLDDPDTCEHGLSATLCYGPGHYPPDHIFLYDPSDEINERYAGERLGWDHEPIPTDGELLFRAEYGGLILQSPDYCNDPRFHTLNCPNLPLCPF